MNDLMILELEQFCPVLADMVRSRELTGAGGKKFSGLEAISSLNTLITLRRLALALKPEGTLEIGLSFGGSCLVFGATHRDLGRAPARQHVALDPFQKQVWDDTGLMAVERAGLSGYMDFRPVFSSLELPRLVEEKRSYGLIYIDGSHLFEDVFVDFFFTSRLLGDRGVVVFDDSSYPQVRKVLGFVRRNLAESFEELDLADFRADRGASLKYRAARFLDRAQLCAFRRVGSPVREWNAALADF